MLVVFIILLVGDCDCDEAHNSDVIVTFGSGHADAERLASEPKAVDQSEKSVVSILSTPHSVDSEGPLSQSPVTEQDSVYFVPRNNEDDDHLRNSEDRMEDLLQGRRTMDEVAKKAFDGATTNGDNVFVTGKNFDEFEKIEKEMKKSNRNHEEATDYSTAAPKRINCKKLDCDHQKLNPTCGAKLDRNTVRYRLFRSKCFLRKVNCGLKYESNRYTLVDLEYCDNIGSHGKPPPSNFRAYITSNDRQKIETPPPETRRIMASRRSQNLDMNGQFCSHFCPAVCPDQYEPECAISATGQKRVFINHCHLDMSSCNHGTAWQMRPLVDCVGEEAAENKQNRGFVSWMQQLGIVDARGRFNKE